MHFDALKDSDLSCFLLESLPPPKEKMGKKKRMIR